MVPQVNVIRKCVLPSIYIFLFFFFFFLLNHREEHVLIRCITMPVFNFMTDMIYVSCRQQEAPDLFEWLCIEELRLCCPPGRFGPDCKGMKNIKH